MGKRVWTHPQTMVQRFVPNEYVASGCGSSNSVYRFECDAGSRRNSYNVFFNGEDGIAETEDDIAWAASSQYNPQHSSGYHPCGETHLASTMDEFINGYMFQKSSWKGDNTGKRIDVIVWTNGETNTHCTQNLDINTWITEKS